MSVQISASPVSFNLINNLWVAVAALLVFIMTPAVGLLEVGERGERLNRSLLKTMVILGSAIFFMGAIGFNTAFAPTIDGIIGNPFYPSTFLLGSFTAHAESYMSSVWWSTVSQGVSTSTYFLFETAFAAVTLALVGVVVLRRMKLSAFFFFSVAYFILIWNLPAAWVWNPTGWLYLLGMRDFAGGLVVHAAAGAAGLAILIRLWRENKGKVNSDQTAQQPVHMNEGMLALSMLLLFMGWFGFNGGSVLSFNSEALIVVINTFMASAAALISTLGIKSLLDKANANLLYAVNGLLMGLIVITPLAGYVSPASAAVLGLISGPVFLLGEKYFSRLKWISDPIGLMPGHFIGGIFGILMIAFFSQSAFAALSGAANLPNGLLFGGGMAALYQFGIEAIGVAAVLVTVFALSYAVITIISVGMHGISANN